MSRAQFMQPAVLALKLIAIGILLFYAPLAWWDLASQTAKALARHPDKRVLLVRLYWITFALGIAAVLVTPFLKHPALRAISIAALIPGFIFERTATAIGALHPRQEAFTYDLMQLSWQARANASDAISAYGYAGWPYFTIAIIFAVAAIMKPPSRFSLPSACFIFLPLTFALAIYVVCKPNTQYRYVFPAPYNIPAYLVRVIHLDHSYTGNRDPIAFKPSGQGARNIIFILDESVRGDFISINQPALDDTPYLNMLAKRGINYGIASSIANCSAPSRLALRSGIRVSELPDKNEIGLHKPTFWQYAQAAGYKTYYLNGFTRGFTFHSFMNYAEARAINKIVPFKLTTHIDRDIAKSLNEIIDAPGKKFIFAEKHGVHYPHDGHNVSKKFSYEPKGMESLPLAYTNEQKPIVREYLRSIRWNVDGFFQTLNGITDRKDTLVIYSSDHGQNMFDNGTISQHCDGANASIGEAAVPLLAFTGNLETLSTLRQSSAQWHNAASAEVIFPTLLAAMGYSSSDVNKFYGLSLFDKPIPASRHFATRDLTGVIKNFDERCLSLSSGCAVQASHFEREPTKP